MYLEKSIVINVYYHAMIDTFGLSHYVPSKCLHKFNQKMTILTCYMPRYYTNTNNKNNYKKKNTDVKVIIMSIDR